MPYDKEARMSQFDYIRSDAMGRWIDIYANLGIEVGDGRHVDCPICQKPGKTKPFRFDDKDGTGSWICTYCGAGDGWGLLMKFFNFTLPEAAYEVRKIIHKCEIKTASVQAKASPENGRCSLNRARFNPVMLPGPTCSVAASPRSPAPCAIPRSAGVVKHRSKSGPCSGSSWGRTIRGSPSIRPT